MAWSCAVVAGIWLACLALFFQGVSFAIPFWEVGPANSTSTLNYYVNFWYSMACKDGESSSCRSKPITPRFVSNSSIVTRFSGEKAQNVVDDIDEKLGHLIPWTALQISATIVIGLTSLAVLIIICCRCAGIHSKCFFTCAGILLLLGGLGAMAIAVLVAIFIAYVFDFTSGEGLSGKTFPYSVLLFGIGGIIGFIAAIFFFVICCKWKQYGRYYQNEDDQMDDDVPMSKISRSRENSKLGYDRPRQRDYERDHFQDDRNYRYDRNGYEKNYKDNGRPEYREFENRGYDRGHEKSYDRGYADSNSSPYRYATTSENMYRPYRY